MACGCCGNYNTDDDQSKQQQTFIYCLPDTERCSRLDYPHLDFQQSYKVAVV
jgi:hypothetical protein